MRIKVLIEKELRQLIHEKYMILGLILVPFILLVVVPFIVGIIGINPTNIPNVEILKTRSLRILFQLSPRRYQPN